MHVLQGASRSCFDAEAEKSLSCASAGPIMKPPCPVAPRYPGIVWDSLGYFEILEGGTTADYFRERIDASGSDLLLTIPSQEPGYDLCLSG
jgi:hypothetical protein